MCKQFNGHQNQIITRFSQFRKVSCDSGQVSLQISPMYKSINNRLRSQMNALVRKHPQWAENDFALHFRQLLMEENHNQEAYLHLLVYFQPCVSKVVKYFLGNYNFVIPEDSQLQKCERCLDLIQEHLENRHTFINHLRHYDPTYGNPQNNQGTKLKTYFRGIFGNILRGKFPIVGDWYLLCQIENTSRPKTRKCLNFEKKLKEALIYQGLNEPEITWRIFVWEYFVIVYRDRKLLPYQMNPNRKRGQPWPEPETSDYQETARVINRNRLAFYAPPKAVSLPDLTPEKVAQWMRECIKALRDYFSLRLSQSQLEQQAIDKQISEQIETEDQEQLLVFNRFDSQLRQAIQTEGFLDFSQSPKIIPREYHHAVMTLCYRYPLRPLTQQEFLKIVTKGKDERNTPVTRFIERVYLNPLTNLWTNLVDRQMIEKLEIKTHHPHIWYEEYIEDFIRNRYTRGNDSQPFDEIVIKVINLQPSENITFLRRQQANLIDTTSKQFKVEFKAIISQLVVDFAGEIAKNNKNNVKRWLQYYYYKLMISRIKSCFNQLTQREQEIINLVYAERIDINNISYFQFQIKAIKQKITNIKKTLSTHLLKSINHDFRMEIAIHNAHNVIEKWLTFLPGYSSSLNI